MLSTVVDLTSDEVQLAGAELAAINDRVAWRVPPEFPRRGRMAWHVLGRAVPGRSGRAYRAVKLKGVGVYNPADEAASRDSLTVDPSPVPRPPTTQPLNSFVTYPHLGFRPDGQFTIRYGSVSPVGGITLAKARREMEAARVLLSAGVPALAPMRVYCYSNLSFQGQPMGAVVTAAPDRSPWRISEAQYGASLSLGEESSRYKYYLRLLEVFEISGNPAAEDTRLQLICALASQVGHRIRQYSTSGLFRYSAELQNFEFDFVSREVLLTDLDSAEFLSSVSPVQQGLEVMRDFASGLYHLLAKFATPRALGHYSISALLAHDPLANFIDGYFGTSCPEAWTGLTMKLWNAFLPHFSLINQVGAERDSWKTTERRTYKMDHHLFFILVLCEFATTFVRDGGDLPVAYIDLEQVTENAKIFLGARSGYLDFLRDFGKT